LEVAMRDRRRTPAGGVQAEKQQRYAKGTDLSIHSVQDVIRIATEVNDRPRETLGWQRPIALFNSQIAMASA
jgi:IS30 family transposase